MSSKVDEITKRMLAESEEAYAVISKHLMEEIDRISVQLSEILKRGCEELKKATDEIYQKIRNEL